METAVASVSTAPALSATDLACRRGDRLLFRGLSLSLSGGDALQVAGPNGSGKTSLIRLLAGLARPFSGEVARSGQVALLDERHALAPHWPLARALGFWARCDGAGPRRIEAALAQVRLDDLLDVPVRYLSTGQRKRAAIARVLLQRAPIWLLDEPLSGLDEPSIAVIERVAGEHCAAGGICVIASHQPIRLDPLPRIVLGGEPA